jgi:hypothetical protein
MDDEPRVHPAQSDAFEATDFSPAAEWRREAAKHALDDLFLVARQYRKTQEFLDLLDFSVRFRTYSPFNAMLLHVQMAVATYVAPASRWMKLYGRRVRRGERPLVILQPMGPVMFVFDVSQTEQYTTSIHPVPDSAVNPFDATGEAWKLLPLTIENCARDGVGVYDVEQGSQSAGAIQGVLPGEFLHFQTKLGPPPEYQKVPRRYDVCLNRGYRSAASYATLVHELAHLYCGHLGTPDPTWWPDRRGLSHAEREFEAEAVSYLVCMRAGIDSPSAAYLSGYLKDNRETPAISLDRVLAAARLIEQMGERRMPPRPAPKNSASRQSPAR